MIEFMKVKSLGDITAWIEQQSVDPVHVAKEYAECWRAINHDWDQHDIQREGDHYMLAVQTGFLELNQANQAPYVYRLVAEPDVDKTRTHGIYFVANDELKVIGVMLSRPEVEEVVNAKARPMN